MESAWVVAPALGFVGLVVLLLVYLSWQTIVMYRIMRSWPRVEGRAHRARARPRNRRSVTVEVDVEYDAAGRTWRGWRGVPDRTGYSSETVTRLKR